MFADLLGTPLALGVCWFIWHTKTSRWDGREYSISEFSVWYKMCWLQLHYIYMHETVSAGISFLEYYQRRRRKVIRVIDVLDAIFLLAIYIDTPWSGLEKIYWVVRETSISRMFLKITPEYIMMECSRGSRKCPQSGTHYCWETPVYRTAVFPDGCSLCPLDRD